VQGINTRVDKLSVEQIIRRRRLEDLINSGIDILDPSSVCIDSSVRIAPGVIIGPHCVISGDTTIEQNVVIDGFSVLHSCTIGDGSTIRAFVHIDGAKVGAHSQIGPYARLREGTVLEGENRIGNFVETKKAVLKRGVKAPHLSYLGDCSIGEASNIGAGTITCNYDGFKKSQTTIGERVFIGSNSALVAPVTIGNDVTIGAGSVITRSVEAESLALTRPEQKEIVGWTARFRKKVRG
jgi:bifunctional UDP-N-acetylglucosamine pyrophosphorylase/glucosamine-1-phosphate N-acetyltransferase